MSGLDKRIARNRMFAALADQFPDAATIHMGDLSFMVQQIIDGQSLCVPVQINETEIKLAKNPDALIAAYVLAARESWDAAITKRNLEKPHSLSA